MKKFSLYLVLLGLVLLTNVQTSFSQNVNVTGAIVGNGTYLDLGSAFTAINGGAQGGASIIVSVVANTTEPVTAVLNQGTWASLSILPAGGATRTISGNIAGPLVDFNGADRVVIDGLNVGGNALIIDNTNNTTASTIRFINDARSLFVQNATILGAGTSVTSGTVFISTSAGGGGNDSIAFNSCTIDASGANFPTNGVYSSGTVGQENSSIGFNTCNIPNFFSATLISRGIFIDLGNTDWIIQGCKFYQAASRTYTTANTHRAIQISSGNNHSITGNTIGYANSGGTGGYTMQGTIATRFIGIDLNVGNTSASSVQGNTISAIGLSTSSGATTTNGVLCGINITGTSNVNVGNITPNIIGGNAGVDLLGSVSTTSGGLVVGINSSSTGTIVIQNNIIGGLTSTGLIATVAGSITGVNVSGVATSMTISGNTIGNATANNMRGGTFGLTTANSLVSGINLPSTPTLANITNNTIQNLSSFGTGTTGFVRGIQTAISGATAYNITNNTVNNLTTNNANTSLSNGQLGTLGIFIGTGTSSVVSGNMVANISNTNSGVVSTNVAGISHAVAGNTIINNNQIYGITNASTQTSTTLPGLACGVFVRGGASNLSIINNMISLGVGQTTNTAFVGIIVYSGGGAPTVTQVFHNTVYIGGTVSSGAQPSMCFYRGNFSATAVTFPVDLRNNIFDNTRTGGTGAHFAIANNYGATVSATGWSANASNNNVLNANATTVGWWGANQTFAGWQTASAGDGASLSGVVVTYVNPANNLHLNMGVTPTAIESGGQTIAMVPTDIDAQNRPGPAGSVNGGAFAPDLGADEFDGVYADISAPAITYTPLSFTCTTGDRVLTSTIVDFSGVPTAGVLQPRVYYRKNAGAYVSTQGTLASGSGTNGTWNFTISAASMGGLVVGDVVSYFVIAQDIVGTPNITSNPAVGLVATDVNTVTTPPTTPNSYGISATLNGTYTVGATGTYPTLTAAVNVYNNSCLSGPVVFSLIDATYPSETFPITVNSNPFASAVNTLTIQPANPGTSITGSSATALVICNGADFVSINGSVSATANTICPRVTASRDLTIANTNVSTTSAVVSLQTTGTGDAVTNNTIKNIIVLGNSNTTTLVGINIGGPTIGSGVGANGNNNNTVENNSIQSAQFGIFSSGVSAGVKNLNNKFDLNTLTGSGANSIARNAITVLFEDAPSVQANTIGNMQSALSADITAISIGTININNTLTTGSEVTNAIISNNKINRIVQTNTFSAGGIVVAATATGTTLVSNNFVDSVFCNGTVGDFGVGILYGGGAGQFNVYNNTVRIDGATLAGASQPNMALGINGTTPNVDIRNNILICSGSTGSNTNTGIGLGYTSTTGNYLNLVSNNNDIFVSGTTPVIGRTGGLAAGTVRTTLLDWQTETGRDAASISTAPVFTGGDLHLLVGSNPTLNNTAASLPSVTNDFDCDSRAVVPDMGADEMASPEMDVLGNSISIVDGDATPSLTDHTDFGSQSACSGTVVRTYTIQNSGNATLNLTSIGISGSGAADYTVGGITLPTTVAAAGSTTFTVTFDPSAIGLSSATISIVNDDDNENAYDYSIQGTGTDPEADVQGNSISIPDGNTTISLTDDTDFGSACLNAGTIQKIYTIENTGTSTMNISSVTTSGADAAMFVVSGAPTTILAANSATFTVTFTPSAAGVRTATVNVNSDDCDEAVYNFDIAALVNTLPSVNVNGTSPICAGDSTLITGTSGGTSQWYLNGVIIPGATSNTYYADLSGSYNMIKTNLNGCFDSAAVGFTLVVNPLPTPTANNTGDYCAGETIQLNSPTGSGTDDWSGPLAYSTTDVQNPTIASSTVAMSGDYTVTVTDGNGCSATATTTVVVNAAPTATASNTGPYCEGAMIQLNSISGSATDDWSGPSYSSSDTQNPTIASSTIAMSGVYTVTVTNGAGCSATATTTVVVNAQPSVNLGPDVIQPNPPAVLDAGSGFATYLWSTSETTQTISVNTNGQYIVTVTTAGVGCSDSDTINVNFTSGVVNVDGTPTIFSLYPNPTTNGIFNVSINNIETTNLVMEVMDMNGSVVHNKYIGSANGNVIEPFSLTELSMGTYIMRITANGKSTQLRFIINK